MTITLDAITLPDDLIWSDEYNWAPVSQSVKKSLTGALIIEEAVQLKGRKITLKGGEGYAWIDKATLELLRAKLNTPNLTMTLTHNGTAYPVMFDRNGSGGVSARGVYEVSDPDAAHIYSVTLKFIEV